MKASTDFIFVTEVPAPIMAPDPSKELSKYLGKEKRKEGKKGRNKKGRGRGRKGKKRDRKERIRTIYEK